MEGLNGFELLGGEARVDFDPVGGRVGGDMGVEGDERLVKFLVVALEAGRGRGVIDVVVESDVEILAGSLGFDVEEPVGGLEEGFVAHGEGKGEEATGLVVGPSEALEVGVLEAVDGEGDPGELGLEVVNWAELVGDGVAGDMEVGAEGPDLGEEVELSGVDEVIHVDDERKSGGVVGELHWGAPESDLLSGVGEYVAINPGMLSP